MAKTNVEFVTDLMEFSDMGPLMQAFVIEALAQYSKQVIKAGESKCDSTFISGKAWVTCAKELQQKFKADERSY